MFEALRRPRRGLSLIEVLASIGVIAIGLLGLASLLPVGQITIFEATKADRAGNCGRAAMRDVVVRRMLDPSRWSTPPNTPAFLIDPLGVGSGMNGMFGNGGTVVPRISLNNVNPGAFICADDLIAPLPENMTPPRTVGRPVSLDPTSGNPAPMASNGDYTWFATVVPTPGNLTRFTVSVVVCYKRILNKDAERAVVVSNFWDTAGNVALSGGSVKLASEISDAGGAAGGINVRENDWVALCNTNGMCRWYRVAAIGDDTSQLTLVGPDWTSPSNGSDKLVALGQNVVGVYTTTVDLDTDPTWKN